MRNISIILTFFFLFNVCLLTGLQGKSKRNFVRSEDNIPFNSEAAKIDGKLDDPVWEKALKIEEFYQYTPINGAAPTEKTVAYVYYNKNNFYVAFRCYDSEPSKIRAALTPRNQWVNNDYVFIYLDTYDNKRDQYLFQINPFGVQLNSFDTIWHSGAVIDSLGWTGEMAIPFKSLRFPDEEVQEWGYELGRNVYRKGETINYLDCRYDEDYTSMFHKAKGLRNLPRGHNIEFLPYSAGKRSTNGEIVDKEAAVGLDAKFGIASNLTLDASFAPDFSQVESDPFFVNFSPYEYQLRENRLFFNEGSSIFSLPHPLFYSRRVENPKTMLKLTGKEGPWNIGAINAWDNPDGGKDRFVHTERLQKDIFNKSKIGLLVSGIEDGIIYNRNISIDGQLHSGSTNHLIFQFASTFSSDAKNTNNTLFYINHSHTPINGFSYAMTYLDIAPDYNPETGIVGITGYRNPSLSMGYKWHLPEWGIETLSIATNSSYSRSYSDLDISKSGGMNASCSLVKKINASLGFSYADGRSQILKENILVWNPETFASKNFNTSLFSNTGSLFDANLNYSYSTGAGVYVDDFQDQAAGVSQSLSCGLTIKPKPYLMIDNKTQWHYQKLGDSSMVLYENLLLYNSLHYQMTRKLYSKIVQNMNIDGKSQLIDLLIGYEFHVGSTFHLSYKELRDNSDGHFSRENYMIFGKMSYLFRL